MPEFSSQTFENDNIVVDGNHYNDCKFDNCSLVFRGGQIPQITGCGFDNCRWQFEDSAQRTMTFLKALYHGAGEGGKELVESTFSELKTPPQK